MTKLSRRFLLVLLVVACCAGAWFWMRRPAPPAENARRVSEEQLEVLKAPPYSHWSKNQENSHLRGVTDSDPSLAYPGYNLYTNDIDEVYLMDMAGTRVHQWRLPGKKQCDTARLLKGGDLMVICAAQALVKMDWNSRILWELDMAVHHDLDVLEDGSYLVLSNTPHEYNSNTVFFDEIVHVSPDGKLLGHWSTFDNLQGLRTMHPPSPLDNAEAAAGKEKVVYDYYHANRLQIIPDNALGRRDPRFRRGNVLLCFRNANLVLVLDSATKKIVWHWGPGILDLPHHPTMLPSGTILIFDNGSRRGSSRVVELDPKSGKFVWTYQGNPPESFFSYSRGSAERLPNGNTLICNSEDAHVFEVTRDPNKIVWSFWNPEMEGKKRKSIYRMIRLPKEDIDPLLKQKP